MLYSFSQFPNKIFLLCLRNIVNCEPPWRFLTFRDNKLLSRTFVFLYCDVIKMFRRESLFRFIKCLTFNKVFNTDLRLIKRWVTEDYGEKWRYNMLFDGSISIKIFFTKKLLQGVRVKHITGDLEYRLGVCRATNGAHIEECYMRIKTL